MRSHPGCPRWRAVAVLALSCAGSAAWAGEPPRPAQILDSTDPEYHPLVQLRLHDAVLDVPVLLAARVEAATAIPLDRYGTPLPPGVAVSPLLRLGVRFESGRARRAVALAEIEGDLLTGAIDGRAPVAGVAMPNAQGLAIEPRKAFARVSFGSGLGTLTVGAGLMTSHWGMGLVANDGAHGWEPASARFTDPRGGDRVLRALVATGPSGPAALGATVAADWVVADDVLIAGDRAWQVVGAMVAGQGERSGGGVYAVWRDQQAPSGRGFRVAVVDLTGRTTFGLGETGQVRVVLEAEAALVAGRTSLGPTPDFPEHDVLQFGAAARAAVHAGRMGGVLDVLYASGDRNLDDGAQNAFRPDPNFEVGMLLYRYVVAAQTGRAPNTAGDPALVGQPAPDLDRIPTRGSATNTLAFFPRGFVRIRDGLEVYGGPLFAFAATDNIDPFNTRIAGGVPRNALEGAAGGYLGTEVDLGVRWRAIAPGAELTAGIEGAVFVAGPALSDPQGRTMDPVWGGRAILTSRM